MYQTDAVILQAVADSLHLAGGPAALQPFWANIVTAEHLRAYNSIVSYLVNRKYTLAQILLWDDGAINERDLALFFLFSSPMGNGPISPETVKQWDVRPALSKLILTIGGKPCIPGGDTNPSDGGQGECSSGAIDATVSAVPGIGPHPDRYSTYRGCGWDY